MPNMNEAALQAHTNEVLAMYTSQKTPLTDGVVKVAEAHRLNEEQVRRLVESANNAAFLHHFQKAGEDKLPDRVVEFEPADSQGALHRLMDAAKDLMSSFSGSTTPPTLDLVQDLPKKEAPELPLATPEAPHEDDPKVSGVLLMIRMHKAAAYLKDQIEQLRWELRDGYTKISADISRNPHTFDQFEKDAVYLHGHNAAPHLTLLRRIFRKPSATYHPEEATKYARVIESSPLLTHMKELIQVSQNITKHEQALAKTQAYLLRTETALRS